MPESGPDWKSHDSILRYEEIVRVVRAATSLGISKVRLTGGEPLVRAGIETLVADLAALPGIDDLSLTTNGALLPKHAESLRRAGLQRVNISLDTLRPDRFRALTRRGNLQQALDGIRAAEEAGLAPIKVNMVVVRGMNDDEVSDIARLTLENRWHVRFIELMPVGSEEGCLPGVCDGSSRGQAFVSAAEIRERVQAELGPLSPVSTGVIGNGPASYYRLEGALGSVGFISAVSEHFCARCNRLRLTADGFLRPCLMADGEIDLRTPLRRGATDQELVDLVARGGGRQAGASPHRGAPVPHGPPHGPDRRLGAERPVRLPARQCAPRPVRSRGT